MKEKVVDRIFSVRVLLAIVILSIICNIKEFTGGGNGEINPPTAAVTTGYILYCSAFALFGQNQKSRKVMILWEIGTLIVAVSGSLISAFRLDVGAIIPFAIVFLTPFQGLVAILSSNWYIVYSVIIVIVILWILFSGINSRGNGKNKKQKRN